MSVTDYRQPAADPRFYVIGGAMQRDARSYVERRADRDLLRHLQQGEFCYVLTSRQMGKSSLKVRIALRLREEGSSVVLLDLTAIGTNVTAEQWYDGLLRHTGRQLRLERELREFWKANAELGPLQRWMSALQEVVLPRCPGPLVLFVDEIDAVRSLPFSTDEFFAAVRECYNRRTEDPEFQRLTFCLLGVATPSDLIRDVRTTPFNIGRRIELNDFTDAEAAALAEGLRQEDGAAPRRDEALAQALLRRVLYWTGGHPYLTQRLCQAIAADAGVTSPAGVDRLCEALFLSHGAQERDDNLLFVRDRLLRSEGDLAGLLEIYTRVRRGKRVPDDETNRFVPVLHLSGVVRSVDGTLRVRNRTYTQVFDPAWVRANMPDAEVQRQRAAFRRGLVRAGSVAAVILVAMTGLAATAWTQKQQAQDALLAERIAKIRAEGAEAQSAKQAHRAQVALGNERLARLETKRAEEKQRAEAVAKAEQARRADQAATEARQARNRAEAARRWAEDNAHRAQIASRNEKQARLATLALLAQGQAASGVRTLEAGDSDGLLDLLEARRRVADIPQLRNRLGALWAGWYEASKGRLRQVVGHEKRVFAVAFSPDGKRLATASEDGSAQLWGTATGKPQCPPLTHGGAVTAVTFSPDGRLLATASGDSTVQLWEAASGKRCGRPLQHAAPIVAMAFSPDGRLLATASDRRAQLWSTATAKAHGPPLQHDAFVLAIAFNPGGTLLATASRDSTARFWDTATGRSVGELGSHRQPVTNGVFSPNGNLLATAAPDGSVQLWDLATRQPLVQPRRHRSAITAMAFSPQGDLLATGATDGTAHLWEVLRGRPRGDVLRHPGSIYTVTFTPDGEKMITASRMTVRLWNTVTAEPEDQPLWHHKDVTAVALSPDGKLLAAASFDATIHQAAVRLWETAPQQPVVARIAHREPVTATAFSPNGKLLATASGNWAWLWNPDTRRSVGQPLRHPSSVDDVAFSPDGTLLATLSNDGTARLWTTATGEPHGPALRSRNGAEAARANPETMLLALPSVNHGSWRTADRQPLSDSLPSRESVLPVQLFAPPSNPFLAPRRTSTFHHLAFSPDGKLLASAVGSSARLWETASGQPHGPPLRHRDAINAVAFSPTGKLLATASRDGSARLWESATCKPHGPPLPHQDEVEALAFSPDGELLATASKDYTAQLWTTATAQAHGPPLWHLDGVWEVVFSPDGRFLATASADHVVQLWQTATGRPHGLPLRHRKDITSLAFSHDGRLLATASEDSTARLWETATGQPHGPPLRHNGSVNAVTFSPDSRRLATASDDSAAYLWRLPVARSDLKKMNLQTLVALGVRHDERGVLLDIPWKAWHELRAELEKAAAGKAAARK